MEDDLIARADYLQRTSFELLNLLHLRELWQVHGTPLLIGSLRTGLMVEPNIDLRVLTDEPIFETCFAVMREVAMNTAAFDVVTFNLANHTDRPEPSIYLGIGGWHRDEWWVIDHLLLGRDHPEADYGRGTTEAILSALKVNGEKRLCLLRIKHERLQKYPDQMVRGGGLPSLDIYRAFFDGGATTYAECEAWAASHPREAYACWVPSA